MPASLHQRLRARIVADDGPLLLPGAPNALTARVLEDAGFEAVYLSGAGVSNSFLGAPDIGLLSLPEIVAHLSAMRDAVEVPLVVDADTGFGNALNVQRTVRALERAGASAIQFEDQVMPKRCGHFDGKRIVDTDEMVGKIQAATDARHDDDLVIIARTDAYAVFGLEEACDRAQRYLEAGADVLFVEAPGTVDDLSRIPRLVPAPHIVNVVEGGRTPALPLAELGDLGFSIVLYANTLMRAAMHAMTSAARELRERGDTAGLTDRIASWKDRQDLVRLDAFDALAERYGGGPR